MTAGWHAGPDRRCRVIGWCCGSGYSLLGVLNHPATPEATGLEVDKLNGRYVQDYMTHYLNSYSELPGWGLWAAMQRARLAE